MADYFEKGTNAGEASAPAQPAGDAVMDDDILVSCRKRSWHQRTNSIDSKSILCASAEGADNQIP